MSKPYLILFIVIILVAIFVVQKFGPRSLSGDNAINTTTQTNATSTQATSTTATSSKKVEEPKLIKEDLIIGTGKEISTWNTAVVNYRGTLADGVQFDSSYERGQPFSFVVGAGEVIKGWDEGILGMKVGGKRKLIIPPALAYGNRGIPGTIPPKATLTFEVALVDVR